MALFGEMLTLQMQLFLLIVLGIFLKKIGLINEQGRKTLSTLLINVILPCNIVVSFISGAGAADGFVKNCILAFLICAVIQTAAIFGGKLLFRRYPREKASVMSYGVICSNSSFIGLPMAEALYGTVGVMYTSIFQIPIRFTMWTAGLSLFTEVKGKEALKKLATHPCILAILIGVTLMVLQVRLPAILTNTLTSLSRCNIPVSMLVIGSILADADVKSLFSKPVLYYTSLRLIFIPALVFAVLMPLPIDPLLKSVTVLMTGMPAGSTTSILADQYDCDSLFASQIVFASTLFSMVTLPILGLFL